MDKTELYSIHLVFADGSNPFVRYNITKDQLQEERSKWEKEYDLRLDKFCKGVACDGGIYFYTATKKGVNHNGDEGSAF